MARAIKTIPLSIGLVQLQTQLIKASASRGLSGEMRKVCTCGQKPKMRIECACGEEFTSWQRVPNKAYPYGDWDKGEILTFSQEELQEIEGKTPIYDTISLQKVIDLPAMTSHYAIGEQYFLVPPDNANGLTLKAYGILMDALSRQAWALLTKITLRGKVKRMGVISDGTILIAFELLDLNQKPEFERVETTQMETDQLFQQLQTAYTKDSDLEIEPEPIVKEIDRRLDELFSGGKNDRGSISIGGTPEGQ